MKCSKILSHCCWYMLWNNPIRRIRLDIQLFINIIFFSSLVQVRENKIVRWQRNSTLLPTDERATHASVWFISNNNECVKLRFKCLSYYHQNIFSLSSNSYEVSQFPSTHTTRTECLVTIHHRCQSYRLSWFIEFSTTLLRTRFSLRDTMSVRNWMPSLIPTHRIRSYGILFPWQIFTRIVIISFRRRLCFNSNGEYWKIQEQNIWSTHWELIRWDTHSARKISDHRHLDVQHFTSLFLSGNQFEDEGIQCVADMLKTNRVRSTVFSNGGKVISLANTSRNWPLSNYPTAVSMWRKWNFWRMHWKPMKSGERHSSILPSHLEPLTQPLGSLFLQWNCIDVSTAEPMVAALKINRVRWKILPCTEPWSFWLSSDASHSGPLVQQSQGWRSEMFGWFDQSQWGKRVDVLRCDGVISPTPHRPFAYWICLTTRSLTLGSNS